MHFEYYEAPDGWRFRLVGRNGERMASGEAYASESNVKRAIRDIIAEMANALPGIRQVPYKS